MLSLRRRSLSSSALVRFTKSLRSSRAVCLPDCKSVVDTCTVIRGLAGGGGGARNLHASCTAVGCGGLWRAVEGCGGLWRVVEGCGGLRRAVEGCGGLWRAVEGCGGLWRVVEGCGGLPKAVEGGGGIQRGLKGKEWGLPNAATEAVADHWSTFFLVPARFAFIRWTPWASAPSCNPLPSLLAKKKASKKESSADKQSPR